MTQSGMLSMTPTPPAWASISEVPTGVPGSRPNSWNLKFTTAATLLHILETDYIMQILDSLSSTIPHTSVPQDDTSFKGEIKVLETDYIVKYNTTYNRLWKQTTLCKFWRFSSWVGWGLVSSLASASLQLSSSLFFLVSCWEYLCLLPLDCALAEDLFLPPSED